MDDFLYAPPSRDPSPAPSYTSQPRRRSPSPNRGVPATPSFTSQAFSAASSFLGTHRRNFSSGGPASPAAPQTNVHTFHNDLPHTPEASSSSGGGIGASFTAGLQDKLFSKVLSGVIPAEYSLDHYSDSAPKRATDRPALSIAVMGSNFRRFNARVGVVFVLQHRLIRLLQWKEQSHTFAFLAVYTFLCIDPTLVAVLPFVALLLFLLVPNFIARHPPPRVDYSHPDAQDPIEPYNAHGMPIAPPVEVKAVSELSKEFFRNLRDLQNVMEDFSTAHDNVIRTIAPPTNFSNERLSSGLFIAVLASGLAMFLIKDYIPFRFILLYHGWLLFGLAHPAVKPHILNAKSSKFKEKTAKASKGFQKWAEGEFIIDEQPERREVEIYELQRKSNSGEWEGWVFSSTPYEARSPLRASGQRPKGCRFFEDVRAPEGWEYVGSGWSVDLDSIGWVRERCIGQVKVEEEGERWVYDVEEEGGMWRRRRWVREVQRKRVGA